MVDVDPGRVPDGIAPLAAYRVWCYAMSEGVPHLLSLHDDGRGAWLTREWNRASCLHWEVTDHKAPVEGCHCGFYATKDLETVVGFGLIPGLGPRGSRPLMMGRVLLAGKVIEHDRGYRAERAKVLDVLPAPGQESFAEWLGAQLGVGVGWELIERWDELSLPHSPTDPPPHAPAGLAWPILIPALGTASARRAVPVRVRRSGFHIAAVLLVTALVVVIAAYAHNPLLLGLLARVFLHSGSR
jgi:hypothetical protein